MLLVNDNYHQAVKSALLSGPAAHVVTVAPKSTSSQASKTTKKSEQTVTSTKTKAPVPSSSKPSDTPTIEPTHVLEHGWRPWYRLRPTAWGSSTATVLPLTGPRQMYIYSTILFIYNCIIRNTNPCQGNGVSSNLQEEISRCYHSTAKRRHLLNLSHLRRIFGGDFFFCNFPECNEI